MLLSEEQVRTYEQEGYVFLTNCYTSCELDVLKAESLKVFAEDTPKRVLEKDHGIVRSVYGSHTTNEVFNKLCGKRSRLAREAAARFSGES